MKYIIMCGGIYSCWNTPKQLTLINGEPIVARTIRLLRECGENDIAISSNNAVFEQFGVPVLQHHNYWVVFGYNNSNGAWVNGFYPMDKPVCYLFGDVVFSKQAIKTIVETDTKDIEFFASAPPFKPGMYFKSHAEPFAFKVFDTSHFKESIVLFKKYKENGKFDRDPMSWELWQIIKGTPLNKINYRNYTIINDFTCDIDEIADIEMIEEIVRKEECN